ncbi:GspH/FimT family pseudopilin [Alishewanella jeotgali]|uniref:Type II secretion system protein H n=1 Tax=Alishewanella jeotgali KCTC 22429 TaxID=1129374 RepID=H3ZCF4_9ALTE|nr:GspH/FimT family pseudopilin [Alishewanella jeotgali]EHR41746.1 methylation site containing protein [Alishewanella jeotgali KCTC 22429]
MRINKSGFSLVELMVTIAVLAIIIGIAAPSFVEMMRQNTLRSQANELLGVMHYARTEAIKRRVNVTVNLTTGNGWKAEVIQPGTTTVLRSVDKTTSSVALKGSGVVAVVFDLRGRRQSAGNCFELSYYGNQRQLLIETGGALKIEAGACGG